jgi:HEAT repeat protein
MNILRQMVVVGFLATLLGGCGNKARDFNELIPRLMKPVNAYSNPMDAAANLFNVTSPDERRDAIAYLAVQKYGHEPAYMKAYKILTTDPHPMVRAQAMRALGTSHQNEAVPYLVDGNAPANTAGKTGLSDPDAEVRRDAAQGLQETFNESAIPALTAHVVDDVDEQVRMACARALKNGRTPAAYRALITALDDKNAGVVYYALQSLQITTGQLLGYDAKAWLGWYQQKYGAGAGAAGATTKPG